MGVGNKWIKIIPIRMGYKIWDLAEAYGWIVQLKPYKDFKKEKQIAPHLNGDKEKTLLCGWWNAYTQLLVIGHLWITMNLMDWHKKDF